MSSALFRSPCACFIHEERELKAITVSIKIQLIVSRICAYLDGVLAKERLAMRLLITPLVKNLLRYIFHSHLVLCMQVFARLPEEVKYSNKWALFLEEIVKPYTVRAALFEKIQKSS
jgi:hypothetical protein